jgi:hypothetical protein
LKIDPLAAASLGLKLAAGVNFGNQLNARRWSVRTLQLTWRWHEQTILVIPILRFSITSNNMKFRQKCRNFLRQGMSVNKHQEKKKNIKSKDPTENYYPQLKRIGNLGPRLSQLVLRDCLSTGNHLPN